MGRTGTDCKEFVVLRKALKGPAAKDGPETPSSAKGVGPESNGHRPRVFITVSHSGFGLMNDKEDDERDNCSAHQGETQQTGPCPLGNDVYALGWLFTHFFILSVRPGLPYSGAS